MKKQILIVLMFTLFLGLTLAGCASNNSGQVSGQSTSDVPVPTDLIKQAYTKGPEDAKVTIVVFSDFQCPACAYAYTQMKQVLAKYGDQIRFAARHFPLSYHTYALEAAYSAEAAGLQGKFWEMYDLIYTNQSSLNSQKFLDFAQNTGLDVDKFKADKESAAVKEKVANDLKDAQALNLEGTPTFYINSLQMKESATAQNFQTAIDKILNQ